MIRSVLPSQTKIYVLSKKSETTKATYVYKKWKYQKKIIIKLHKKVYP